MRSGYSSRAGAKIRQLREDRGWTQADMAAEIERQLDLKYWTSERTIWRVESGHKPTVKRFAIAHVLGTTPSVLWPENTTRAAA